MCHLVQRAHSYRKTQAGFRQPPCFSTPFTHPSFSFHPCHPSFLHSLPEHDSLIQTSQHFHMIANFISYMYPQNNFGGEGKGKFLVASEKKYILCIVVQPKENWRKMVRVTVPFCETFSWWKKSFFLQKLAVPTRRRGQQLILAQSYLKL